MSWARGYSSNKSLLETPADSSREPEETITHHRVAEPPDDGPIPWFQVATQLSDRVVIVSVRGELDMATGPMLADNVRCHDGQYDRMVYDLHGLGFMDIVGFRTLLGCTHKGEPMSIRNPSHPVRRLLQLVSREDLIEGEPHAGLVPTG